MKFIGGIIVFGGVITLGYLLGNDSSDGGDEIAQEIVITENIRSYHESPIENSSEAVSDSQSMSAKSPDKKTLSESADVETKVELSSLPRREQGDRLRKIIETRAAYELPWLLRQSLPDHPWVRAAFVEALGVLAENRANQKVLAETAVKIETIIQSSLIENNGESLSTINSSIEALGKINHKASKDQLETMMFGDDFSLLQKFLSAQNLAKLGKVEYADSLKSFGTKLKAIDPENLEEYERPLLEEALVELERINQ